MTMTSFRVPKLAELYSRPYTEDMQAWRTAGAHDKVANLLELVEPVRGQIKRVLEVGCGTGAVLAMLSGHLGTELVGIDVGAQRDRESRPSIRFQEYDGTNVPFADETFDLVYATHVLEHVLDERGFLRELRRVSGRYIYVEVPCELHARTSGAALQRSLDIGHINAYTPESFALTLETSGLRIRRLAVFDRSYAVHRFHASAPKAIAMTAIRRALLRASPTLASRVFTYHASAICERGELP
jgi:SAM-dependent methyltransferase